LRVGELAQVVALVGDRETRYRLMDLGMVPGTRVEVLRSSPLGDPVVYRLRGTMVALRRPDAEVVQVQCLEPAS
jgi:ferrous iron transport protein A